MLIYNYDLVTKEYMGSCQADLDPEETKIQGKDVYLIPACATTKKPPKQKEDKAIVWNDGSWVYVDDFRQNYYKVDSMLHVMPITTLGEQTGYIVISKELGDAIMADYDNYIIDNNAVREKTAEEKQAEEEARVNNLTMTPLDFIGVLVQIGLTLEQINEFLESNLNIKIQLTYCNLVYCGVVKQFLPLEIDGITITAAMIEQAFKIKNGEIQ